MLEVEKKRQDEIDSKMNVTIDLDKGTTKLKKEDDDKMFAFGNQNKLSNQFMMATHTKGGKFRPFEEDNYDGD